VNGPTIHHWPFGTPAPLASPRNLHRSSLAATTVCVWIRGVRGPLVGSRRVRATRLVAQANQTAAASAGLRQSRGPGAKRPTVPAARRKRGGRPGRSIRATYGPLAGLMPLSLSQDGRPECPNAWKATARRRDGSTLRQAASRLLGLALAANTRPQRDWRSSGKHIWPQLSARGACDRAAGLARDASVATAGVH
jgi:hypothetical protein